MNKKLIYIILAVLVLVCIIVIISIKIFKKPSEDGKLQNETNGNTDVLVVFFSMAGEVYNVGDVEVGNTELVASYIKEYLNADLFKIEPKEAYPTKYEQLLEISKKEQERKERPEIKNKIKNLDKYNTIFIGYPIWNDDLPPIVYTFLEEYDFSGKTIIPFNTHEGSWAAGTYDIIKGKLLKSYMNREGLSIKGSNARTENGKETTINWLKSLGY